MNPKERLIVAREMVVKPGHEAAFEEAMSRLVDVANRAPGHMGVTVVRPQTPGTPYRFLYRFDSTENLQAWHSSPERAARMEEVQPHIESDTFQVQEGFMVWLDMPLGQATPPKWKIVFLTWLGLVPTVVLVSTIFDLLNWHPDVWVRAFVNTAITVPTAAYLLVPLLSRLLRRWLMGSA